MPPFAMINYIIHLLLISIGFTSAFKPPHTTYDVIVVGGGPSGLSAASAMSRIQRTVVLFDSQQYRNDPTRCMHDVLGFDGIQPKRFREAAQSQIMKYNKTTFRHTTVTKLVKWSTKEGFTMFNATDSDGNIYTARKVILGTGIKDDLPNTPHLSDYFGKGIYWCPWCDGFEHRNQTMGILGPMSEFFASVIEVYPTLNKNITAYVNGTNTKEQRDILDKTYPHWETAIRNSGIRVENKIIARIDRIRNGTAKCDADRVLDQFNISFTTGESEVRDVFITNFGIEQRSDLASQLQLQMDGPKVHNKVCYRSSLDGVWAVGDITNDNSTNVEHAMGTAKAAAVDCHRQLSNEELLGRPYDWSSKDC